MSGSKLIALVTGANRGIGKAISVKLASMGYFVVSAGIDEASLEEIKATQRELGIEGGNIQMDVSSLESVEKAWADVVNLYGAPSVLVNNAGITRDNLIMRMKDSEWSDVIKTNLDSVFYLSRLAVKSMMKARHGKIVNIASVVGLSGNPGQANYCASKAGVIGLTKSLAQEVGSRGITVNAIAPGFIVTPMTDKLNEDQKAALLAKIPLGRLGTPEDIAETVSFLVSDAGGYITGQTINVSGGMYM
jgi:3-oxoacyl-[acyl-carrier protein] reductase